MPQGVDGIHSGRLQGREISEYHAHGSQEEKGNEDDGKVQNKGDGKGAVFSCSLWYCSACCCYRPCSWSIAFTYNPSEGLGCMGG